ncbi:ATP-binding protein [Aeromonas veronii]|uniref:ATP-binding protein n=1 Tax=Aeromonas TaxID=642 RepID=UPI0018F22F32|nr:ATP-binding protein [Aeromonas veronii]MBJ7580764.1 ATP-binding protein [Aeromonas veronii]MEB5669620.1 ATP-binding protein [Aeromonas veronii]HDX8429589.1 ATP-binding protein [Aeromonas veronii]
MNSENNIFAKFKAQKAKIKNVDSYFTPSKPIEAYTHLKGRDEEVQHILGTLTTAGQHCMIYGERGIGKSSLALSTLEGGKKAGIFTQPFFIKRCDNKTKFKDIIQQPVVYLDEDYVAQKKEITTKSGIGLNLAKLFRADVAVEEKIIIEKEDLTASKVCQAFNELEGILLIDEFDVVDNGVKHEIAELIKQLSDSDSKLKILLVGIASDGASLIDGHQSVNRCLHEIKLSRIEDVYLHEIIVTGEKGLEIEFDEDVKNKIIEISNGFPYFTHLISKESAEIALSESKNKIDQVMLARALEKAVINTEGQLKRAYDHAVTSSRTSVYPSILYAAAKFPDNRFTIQEWISQIKDDTGTQYTNYAMSNYIGRFTREDKGKIITKAARGVYTITDPRMPSYIRMINS